MCPLWKLQLQTTVYLVNQWATHLFRTSFSVSKMFTFCRFFSLTLLPLEMMGIWPKVRSGVIWLASGKLGESVLYLRTWHVQQSTAKNIFGKHLSVLCCVPVPMFNSWLLCTCLMESKPGWSRASQSWWNFVASQTVKRGGNVFEW